MAKNIARKRRGKFNGYTYAYLLEVIFCIRGTLLLKNQAYFKSYSHDTSQQLANYYAKVEGDHLGVKSTPKVRTDVVIATASRTMNNPFAFFKSIAVATKVIANRWYVSHPDNYLPKLNSYQSNIVASNAQTSVVYCLYGQQDLIRVENTLVRIKNFSSEDVLDIVSSDSKKVTCQNTIG